MLKPLMLVAAAIAVALPASGDPQRLSVVELYTSQGCSSCPPADALLAELDQHENILPLALHVDYWDYLGWIDTFGSADFVRRQKAYAKAVGQRMVYTPQMVINGTERIVGADAAAVAAALGDPAAPLPAGLPDLTLDRDGDQLRIRANAPLPLPVGSFVQVVRYIPSAAVEIQHGENAGRTITYTNIVTSWQRLGEWDGVEPIDTSLQVMGEHPVAVLIQEPGPGRILAAAVVE